MEQILGIHGENYSLQLWRFLKMNVHFGIHARSY
jgi:hypothetical protein